MSFFSGFRVKKKESKKTTKGVQPLRWWCSGRGSKPKERESIPSLGPQPLINHKVSRWLKSERKGLGKIEKSRWCSSSGGAGAVVLKA